MYTFEERIKRLELDLQAAEVCNITLGDQLKALLTVLSQVASANTHIAAAQRNQLILNGLFEHRLTGLEEARLTIVSTHDN